MYLLYIETVKNIKTLLTQKKIINFLPENTEVVTNEFLFRNAILKNQYKLVICVVESYLINQYIMDLYKSNQLYAQGSFLHIKDSFIETSLIKKSIHHEDTIQMKLYTHENINLKELISDQIYPKSECIFIKEKTVRWNSIHHKNILCIESKDVKSLIYTTSGQSFEIQTSQRKLIESLPQNFARVHRSFYVNKNHIYEVTNGFLQLVNGFRIPLSKKFSKEFKQSLLLPIGA